jgi:DNA-binding Lrp family transcriptional regulator
MSFNEIADFRTALSQLTKTHPGLVKGGWRSVMWVIVSYPDGCFIGYKEIADQAGYSPDTVKTYLRELTKLGFILREQKWVRKGVRQCYRIDVKAITDFDSVAPDTPNKPKSTVIGVPESVKSVTGSPNECDLSPTYIYKDKDKYDKTKTERFSNFLSLLPEHLQGLQQGKNIDEPLDRLDVKGVPLQVTVSHLSEHNYTGAVSPYGVLISRLNTFSIETTDLITERKLLDQQNRLITEQLKQAERDKVPPSVASEYANSIREQWKRKPE